MVDLWPEQLAILNSIRFEPAAVVTRRMEEARAMQEAAQAAEETTGHAVQAPTQAISDEEENYNSSTRLRLRCRPSPSGFVLGPGAVRCAGCHQHPPATVATTKAREKPKGARKLRAADVALNHRLVSWRVGGGTEDGPAATGEYNYRGASTSAVLAHLAGGNNWHAEDKEEDDADLVAAALRGISDLYDLIVSLQAARGGQEDDAHGTATAADTDEIEEHDAEITDDVDEDEEEEDDGICVVRGITSALEFSDGEEDWIVV
ncbi:hypothetical protein D1007_35428 [Hordeum vulgare]|nr:hypothetical protein D1007_35428 [Hordeum vulgare]